MRLRPALLAVASALLLVTSVSTTAHADPAGGINYRYTGSGEPTDPQASLVEQPLHECIAIPEVQGVEDTYAYSAKNVGTESSAELYSDDNCTGTKTVLVPDEEAGDSVHFRSVKFVPTSTG
ncbi:hypothetical protein [Streptomyces sp. NPDC059063]|uniref:hypothetical protein n=1 Tax=unclassified Streptomyces TaxID=2593676 RepID=UPI0036833EC5